MFPWLLFALLRQGVSALIVLFSRSARLLNRVFLGISRHLVLYGFGNIDASDVGELQGVDEHICELLTDFRAFDGIIDQLSALRGVAPEKVLHELRGFRGQ